MITKMSEQEKKQLLWACFVSGDIFIGVRLRFKVRLWLRLMSGCKVSVGKVSVKVALGQVRS